MSNQLSEEVKEVQSICFKNVFDSDESKPKSNVEDSLLGKITKVDQDVAEAALGQDFAQKVLAFVNAVDLEHPAINDLFEGQLLSGDFSKECASLLGLAAYAKDKEPLMLGKIKKLFPKDKIYKKIERSIDDPSKNQLHVRLIKDNLLREKIRSSKKMQVINSNVIEKKGYDIWISNNSTFSNYCRKVDVWGQEIRDAEKQLEKFQVMGCKDLAKGIEDDIKVFKLKISESYLGFNRISMTSAAILLAKIHGFELKNVNSKTRYKIMIPRSFFGELSNFCAPVGDNALGGDYSYFEYEPRSYTVNEMTASYEMQRMINYLESFPEMDGKPIFDHFRILVPGIKYPNGNWKKASYINESGIAVSDSSENVKRSIDMMFVKNKLYYPILLGEKDEFCYFICYWV